MDFVLTIVLVALALAALAYPLYRAHAQTVTVNASTLDDLLAERDGVYATLRDLELDRQLGKLDAADYNALHEKYMMRAAQILQELDTLRGKGAGEEAGAEIEKEVAALRQKTTDDRRRTASKQEQEAGKKELRCANCGRPYSAGDKFCARCGRALS